MGTVAAVMFAADRRLCSRLGELGAVSRETARPVEARGGMETRRLQNLQSRGVIHRVGADRYYLDEAAWASLRKFRQVAAFIALDLAIIGVFLVWLFSK